MLTQQNEPAPVMLSVTLDRQRPKRLYIAASERSMT